MTPALEGVESDDLLNLVCGEMIGEGQYRQVFNCHLNPDWVIKKEKALNTNHSNIYEFGLYSEFMDTEFGRRWLAPIKWLSPRGLWLIQMKTQPVPDGLLPKQIPTLFCDLKRTNWGMLNGRVVCHDYGNNGMFKNLRPNVKRMKKATWISA